MAEQTIPVIDLTGPGTEARDREIADEIRKACEEIGFFMVSGHGVSADLIARTRETAKAFFALPLDEKMKVRQPENLASRGYAWPKNRGLGHSSGLKTPPDIQESYALGPNEPVPAHLKGTAAEDAFFLPNYFPETPAELGPQLTAYYAEMEKLADRILGYFALGLGLERDHFAEMLDHHTSTMRVIHYPPIAGEVEDGQLRAGEHTDYGTLTIVRGDDVPGGLQVRTLAGEWVDVHPPEGAFVCNIGDLMRRWTNDRWLSNLHRVAVPPEEYRDTARISLVFFHNPNADAVIRCITDGTESPKHPPQPFGEIFLGKHLKAQSLSA